MNLHVGFYSSREPLFDLDSYSESGAFKLGCNSNAQTHTVELSSSKYVSSVDSHLRSGDRQRPHLRPNFFHCLHLTAEEKCIHADNYYYAQTAHAIYTVNHKKRDILFLTVTLANLTDFFIVFISF